MRIMVTPRGVEPPTFPLGGGCSILLSYGVFLSRPISRILSWTIIHLRYLSPNTCSDLPGIATGRRIDSLFGLAPSGVYPAVSVTKNAVRPYRTFSPLPLAGRYIFCGTFRRLAPPGRYPALCPAESGLSSNLRQRLPGRLGADCTQKCRAHKFLHGGVRVAIVGRKQTLS